MTRWAVPLLCVLSTLPVAAAEEAAGPTFVAETAGGTPVTGPLQRLGGDWALRLGDGGGRAGDLLRRRQAGKPLPRPPVKEQLVFVNGDRTPGTLLKVADERVTCRLAAEVGAAREVELPLAAVAVIWLAAPDGADRPD